jgi:hypothetical protein
MIMKKEIGFMRYVFALFLSVGLFISSHAAAQTESTTFILPKPSSFLQSEQEKGAQPDVKVEKRPLLQRYYDHSGRSMVSVLSVGYSTYFLIPGPGVNTTQYFGKRHILNFEIFEWRARLFGMSLFNFEMGVNTPHAYPGDVLSTLQRGGKEKTDVIKAEGNTMWFAYKPGIKVYIPVAPWCAAIVYGGVSVDLTRLWSKIATSYYKDHPEVPEQNFFLGAYGGAGFSFTTSASLPIEVKAEYRHPVMGNTALVPQGIYLTAQLHIGNPVRKNNDDQQKN